MKSHRKNILSFSRSSNNTTSCRSANPTPMPDMFEKAYPHPTTIEKSPMVLLSQHRKNYLPDFNMKEFEKNVETVELSSPLQMTNKRLKKTGKYSINETYGYSPKPNKSTNSFLIRGYSPDITKASLGRYLDSNISTNLDLTTNIENNVKYSLPIRDDVHDISDFILRGPSSNKRGNHTVTSFTLNNLKIDSSYEKNSNVHYIDAGRVHSRGLESPSTNTITRTKSPKPNEYKVISLKDLKLDKDINGPAMTQSFNARGKRSNLAATMNLVKQNKKKNELISHAYTQQNGKEILHIRTPSKQEALKLQKDRKKEHKALLKVLGANTPLLSQEYELKTIHF